MELVCPICRHAKHGDSGCEEITVYDHMNGDHECGCPGELPVLLEDDGHTTKLTVGDGTEDWLMVSSDLSRDERIDLIMRLLRNPCSVVDNAALEEPF